MRTYLDANATTPIDPEALAKMTQVYAEVWGNASSVHSEGRAARQIVEKARAQIAKAVKANTADIIFTSGASEANNTAITAAAKAAERLNKRHIVASAVEHPSVIGPIERLVREEDFSVSWIKPDRFGRVPPETVLNAVCEQTGLVTLMAANNEIGNKYELSEIVRELANQAVHVHADCVQVLGKEDLDLTALGVSSASFSAHKIYGPKGVGALYWDSSRLLRPFMVGGHQERERRAGTEAVALIAAFGVVAKQAQDLSDQRQLRSLTTYLWTGVQDRIEGVHLNGDPDPTRRIANTLNVSFDDTEGETLLISLDLAGFSVSSGSACTAGSLEPSHVLTAMGFERERARASVRFSLARGCRQEDINRLLQVLPEIVETVRSANASPPSGAVSNEEDAHA